MSAAADLVSGGTMDGRFFALDASTGRMLWSDSVSGRVHAAPITFVSGGIQYVAIASGTGMHAFSLQR